jgi:hypothetical protein
MYNVIVKIKNDLQTLHRNLQIKKHEPRFRITASDYPFGIFKLFLQETFYSILPFRMKI